MDLSKIIPNSIFLDLSVYKLDYLVENRFNPKEFSSKLKDKIDKLDYTKVSTGRNRNINRLIKFFYSDIGINNVKDFHQIFELNYDDYLISIKNILLNGYKYYKLKQEYYVLHKYFNLHNVEGKWYEINWCRINNNLLIAYLIKLSTMLYTKCGCNDLAIVELPNRSYNPNNIGLINKLIDKTAKIIAEYTKKDQRHHYCMTSLKNMKDVINRDLGLLSCYNCYLEISRLENNVPFKKSKRKEIMSSNEYD